MEYHAVATYGVYILISVGITIWVGHTLHKNGAAFLEDAFGGNLRLSESVNHLLVVGFYLINLGYVSVALQMKKHPATVAQCIEFLSQKLGWVLLVLGAMHFFNIYVFSRFRKNSMVENLFPPVGPDTRRYAAEMK